MDRPASDILASQKSRLLETLSAIAHEHGVLFTGASAPPRFIDGTRRASIRIVDADTPHALAFRFAITEPHRDSPAVIWAIQQDDARFVCDLRRGNEAAPYDGTLPEVAEGMLSETDFLALARRCFAFYAKLAVTQPITENQLREAYMLFAERNNVPIVETIDARCRTSEARSTAIGWKARFAYIAPVGPDDVGSFSFAIRESPFIFSVDPARHVGRQPGFLVNITGVRDGSGRFLLRIDFICTDYCGPRPNVSMSGNCVDEAMALLAHCATFYRALPSVGSMPVAE